MTDRGTKLYHSCSDCGTEVDPRRAKLGYHVCLTCGEGLRQGSKDGLDYRSHAQIELRTNH
jgi:ribosomal protein L37AE/L43A